MKTKDKHIIEEHTKNIFKKRVKLDKETSKALDNTLEGFLDV